MKHEERGGEGERKGLSLLLSWVVAAGAEEEEEEEETRRATRRHNS